MSSGLPVAGEAAEEPVRVLLLGYPLAVGLRANEHYEDVFRELALLAATSPQDGGSVAARVTALVDELGRGRARNNELDAERLAALDRHEQSRDLELHVPPSVLGPSRALDLLLDEVDELCRAGAVLALAPDDDVVAFRRWYLAQLVHQVAGEPPTPWPGGTR